MNITIYHSVRRYHSLFLMYIKVGLISSIQNLFAFTNQQNDKIDRWNTLQYVQYLHLHLLHIVSTLFEP